MTLFSSIFNKTDAPEVRRVRHELRKRTLEVIATEHFTPHMIRITLTGEDLHSFVSPSPDDHIKIFVTEEDGSPTRRDYTPRRFDPKNRTLVLDFVDHEGGPAAAWARTATPGTKLEIAGPRGSQIIDGDVRHWLLIGDETALPAIGRRVEELDERCDVTTIVTVPDSRDEQIFSTSAKHDAHWVHRTLDQADQAEGILSVLQKTTIAERTFVWVGAEANVARAVRRYLIEERKISPQWIKASGYWLKGQADSAVKDVGSDH